MSYQKKQRTRIEDLSVDENQLFELSEQMMMMVGGGYGETCPTQGDPIGTYSEIELVCKVDGYEVIQDPCVV